MNDFFLNIVCFYSLENFCTDGVGLLKSLIQSRHLRAAVHLLDNILPPTYPLSFYLLNNAQWGRHVPQTACLICSCRIMIPNQVFFNLLPFPRFVSCIQLFLQYDSVCPQGVTQQVTHRVAPLLTGTTYGDNVRLLNSAIQVHPTIITGICTHHKKACSLTYLYP